VGRHIPQAGCDQQGNYQRRTEREIPLVRLSPLSTGMGSNAPATGIIAP